MGKSATVTCVAGLCGKLCCLWQVDHLWQCVVSLWFSIIGHHIIRQYIVEGCRYTAFTIKDCCKLFCHCGFEHDGCLAYMPTTVVVQPALRYHITNSQSRYITPTRLRSAQYSLHNNAPSSRKILKMDVLTSETCWAVNWHNKASVIKLVYLYSNNWITSAAIACIGIEILPHPVYCPDLAPSDFLVVCCSQETHIKGINLICDEVQAAARKMFD